jgi:hypothetical protein
LERGRPTEIVVVEDLMDDLSASAKPRLLLDHFSESEDARQLWRVAYPLREILFRWCAERSRAATTMTTSSVGHGAFGVPAGNLGDSG